MPTQLKFRMLREFKHLIKDDTSPPLPSIGHRLVPSPLCTLLFSVTSPSEACASGLAQNVFCPAKHALAGLVNVFQHDRYFECIFIHLSVLTRSSVKNATTCPLAGILPLIIPERTVRSGVPGVSPG
jgi:hypothetical protein